MVYSPRRLFALAMAATTLTPAMAYNLSRDYSGQHFFDGWDYYGSWDNLTLSEFSCLLTRCPGSSSLALRRSEARDMFISVSFLALHRTRAEDGMELEG